MQRYEIKIFKSSAGDALFSSSFWNRLDICLAQILDELKEYQAAERGIIIDHESGETIMEFLWDGDVVWIKDEEVIARGEKKIWKKFLKSFKR